MKPSYAVSLGIMPLSSSAIARILSMVGREDVPDMRLGVCICSAVQLRGYECHVRQVLATTSWDVFRSHATCSKIAL